MNTLSTNIITFVLLMKFTLLEITTQPVETGVKCLLWLSGGFLKSEKTTLIILRIIGDYKLITECLIYKWRAWSFKDVGIYLVGVYNERHE